MTRRSRRCCRSSCAGGRASWLCPGGRAARAFRCCRCAHQDGWLRTTRRVSGSWRSRARPAATRRTRSRGRRRRRARHRGSVGFVRDEGHAMDEDALEEWFGSWRTWAARWRGDRWRVCRACRACFTLSACVLSAVSGVAAGASPLGRGEQPARSRTESGSSVAFRISASVPGSGPPPCGRCPSGSRARRSRPPRPCPR